jgi:hypothetical protein
MACSSKSIVRIIITFLPDIIACSSQSIVKIIITFLFIYLFTYQPKCQLECTNKENKQTTNKIQKQDNLYTDENYGDGDYDEKNHA